MVSAGISQHEIDTRTALARVFGQKAVEGIDLAELVAEFQRIWGLEVDGVAGKVTNRWLNAPRYCAVPDRMAAGRLEKWDDPTRPLPIKWCIGTAQNSGALPGITSEVLASVYAAAWAQWAKVANLGPSLALSLQEAWVTMGSGSLDGPNGTLAWSYLPMGTPDRKPLEQRYDVGEPWDTTIVGTPQQGRVSLLAVATHEIGHALGLDHGGRGLMAPYYNESILAPQPGYDIDQMVARYGPPSTTPPGPGPGPGPGPSPDPTTMWVSYNGITAQTSGLVLVRMGQQPTPS